MSGNVDGAYKRKDKKRKHNRVAINLDKKVIACITKLAKRAETTAANWCREILTAEVAVKFPKEFEEYMTFVNNKSQVETQLE